MTKTELTAALAQAEQDTRNMQRERDAAHREVADRAAQRDAAVATIRRVRLARDDWHARGYMSAAKELSAILDGAS